MLAIVLLALAFAQKDRTESHLVAKIPDDCRIVEGSMRFSRDGEGFAYAARIDGKWHVFAGSKQSDPCDEVACVTWSDDGWSVFYGCRNGAELWWRKVDAE